MFFLIEFCLTAIAAAAAFVFPKLIRYFKDRQVWLIEADETPARLSPYPGINNANDAIKRGEVSFPER